MNYTVYSGPPGCGKSSALLDQIVERPGRHLLAAPRTALLEEHAARLRYLARVAGVALSICAIHSGQSKRGGVMRRLAAALRDHDRSRHVVVLVTHEALLSLDPSLLTGWQVGIDELPDTSIASGVFSAAVTWTALAHQYRLDPSADARWWRVVPHDDVEPHSIGAITQGASDQILFHRLIRRGRPVFVDMPDWEQARALGRRVGWWSLWMLTELSGCLSVSLTAASWPTSLVGLAHRRLHADALTCHEQRVGAERPRAQPLIRLHFYTRHRGSTAWWETDEGSRCLVKISDHLKRVGFDGYWSCNSAVMPYFRHRLGGRWCEPRQAGTNNLRDYAACMYIYSNKSQSSDQAILDVLGVDRDIIMRTREYEDIMQFAMRGAVRDAGFAGTYDVHLYSEDQAVALKAALIEHGISNRVELIAVDEAGIMDVVRPPERSSRARVLLDPRTSVEQREQERKAERDRGRRRREARAEQRQRDGTARGRGRPRKQSIKH